MFGKEKEKSIVDIAKEFDDNPKVVAPTSPANETVPEVSDIKDQVSELLENIKGVHSYVEFNLPSLGKAYPAYDKQTIGIRPLRFSDEKAIQAQAVGDRALDGLNAVLKSCLQGPEYSELTLPDKLFALFKLRQLSYGSEYPMEPECGKCGHTNQLTFQLSSMEVKYLEDSLESTITVNLPDSKKTAIVRVLQTPDEAGMASIKDVIDALPRYVESVGGITDRNVITLFLEGTTVRDVSMIRNAIFTPNYGIIQECEFYCDKCGANGDMQVGINANFFSPS